MRFDCKFNLINFSYTFSVLLLFILILFIKLPCNLVVRVSDLWLLINCSCNFSVFSVCNTATEAMYLYEEIFFVFELCSEWNITGFLNPGEQIRWQKILNFHWHKEAPSKGWNSWRSSSLDGGIASCQGYVPTDVQQWANGSHQRRHCVNWEAKAAAFGRGCQWGSHPGQRPDHEEWVFSTAEPTRVAKAEAVAPHRHAAAPRGTCNELFFCLAYYCCMKFCAS